MPPLLLRVAAAMVLAVVAVGCSRGEPETEPTPSVSQTPTFEVHPVVGERVEASYHVSSLEIMGTGTRAPFDDPGAATVREAIASWLDGHLDDLQYGGDGNLAAVASPELPIPEPEPTPTASISEQPSDDASGIPTDVDGGQPPPDPRILAVTTDLTSPQNPVASARYHLAVYGEGVLEWATARVEVTRADGTIAGATFVFTIGEDYAVTLVMAGPEPGPESEPEPDAETEAGSETATEDES